MRFVFRAGSMMQGGNFVVRKSALDAADAFNPNFSFYGEDTELARRLSKVGAVKFSFRAAGFFVGRRLAAEGLFRVAFQYSINYLWTICSNSRSPRLARFSPSRRYERRRSAPCLTPRPGEPPGS